MAAAAAMCCRLPGPWRGGTCAVRRSRPRPGRGGLARAGGRRQRRGGAVRADVRGWRKRRYRGLQDGTPYLALGFGVRVEKDGTGMRGCSAGLREEGAAHASGRRLGPQASDLVRPPCRIPTREPATTRNPSSGLVISVDHVPSPGSSHPRRPHPVPGIQSAQMGLLVPGSIHPEEATSSSRIRSS